MDDNTYQPPKANLYMPDTKRGSPLKAVLLGALVDIVGSAVAGILMGIIYGLILASSGMPPDAAMEKLSHISSGSPLSVIGIVVGSLVTLYAGYLCAKIANHREYVIVSVLGVISVSFGFLTALLHDTPTYDLLEKILLSLLTFFCVYLGAWLHVRTKKY